MPAAQGIPALTQVMMNALPGNAAIWRRYLSDRAVYVSEAGEVAVKEELLQGFGPFPEGVSGAIEVKNVRITDFGDVAISVFDAHEKQSIYDQKIEVNYRATHTWRRENGRWRLIAAQNVVLAKDPSSLPIDVRRLSDYTGTYALSGKRRYRVEQRGDTLVGGRENTNLTPLLAVGDNVFVEAGSDLGILRIFVRGRAGAVERMVQRRKFADLNWTKVPAVTR
jgi:ketosteroid isomerase-like protein